MTQNAINSLHLPVGPLLLSKPPARCYLFCSIMVSVVDIWYCVYDIHIQYIYVWCIYNIYYICNIYVIYIIYDTHVYGIYNYGVCVYIWYDIYIMYVIMVCVYTCVCKCMCLCIHVQKH